MQVFLVIALLIALIAVVFAVQNTALVTISFLLWKFNNSLAVVLLLAIFAGVLISIFASLPGWIRGRMAQSTLKKKIRELEMQLGKKGEQYLAAEQELELYRAVPAEPALIVEETNNEVTSNEVASNETTSNE